MKSEKRDKTELFTRRAFFVGGVQISLLGLLGGRLAWLQVAQGQRYKMLSDKNRINIKMVAPSRGQILDRFGRPLAENDQNFRVLIVPEQTDDLKKTLAKIQPLIDLDEAGVRAVLEKAKKTAPFVPLRVKDNVPWEEVARVEVNLPDLPGLSIDVGEVRNYPYEQATAHVVGHVGAVSQAEMTDDPVLKLPGFKIGKTGVEKAYDKPLRGTAGTAEVEVNVVGREVRHLKTNPGKPGQDVRLSLDIELQTYIQDRLSKEKSATAVVMDAKSGAVYAMASSPSFDPNLMTRGISANKLLEIESSPGHAFVNKALAGQYPPGSTFKMITALAALEEGIITRNTTTHCKGHYDYGGQRFHCWKWAGHGRMDLTEALSQSCDTFFYKIATDIGIDKLAAYARRFGLGQRLGFDLDEERPGLMPDKSWKMGHFGQHWRLGETIVASIGQGYIQSTPLQLATMTARLVNGGYAVRPWITALVGDEKVNHRAAWPRMNVNQSHLDLVVRGMNRSTTSARGTAVAAQIPDKNRRMGGKTGTSQVRRITMEERREGIRNEDLPWRLRHHALFVGHAPLDKPRYVCSVVVEHGGSGSAAAAPIARDLLFRVQQLEPDKIDLHNIPPGTLSVRPPAKPAPHSAKAEL